MPCLTTEPRHINGVNEVMVGHKSIKITADLSNSIWSMQKV